MEIFTNDFTVTFTNAAAANKAKQIADETFRALRFDELLKILITDIFLGFSVVFELSDLLHGVLLDRAFQVHPIKEYPQIADVVVDRANADRFAEVPAPVREVLFFSFVVAVERVFPSLLEIVDVSTNDSFCDLIHIDNV